MGGADTIFPVLSGVTALDFCVRLVSYWWPNSVFILDDDSTIYTRYRELILRANSEVIIYRDKAACDAWDELGYHDSLKGTMVYLISEPNELTLVTEHDPLPQIVALIEAIRYGLPTAFPLWISLPLSSEAA